MSKSNQTWEFCRNQADTIFQIKQANPELKNVDIGRQFNLTGQRVSQILRKKGWYNNA